MAKARGRKKTAATGDGCKKGEFIVEKVVGKRIKDGKPEYLLKWKNFPHKQNTWEPEENLNCKKLLEQFAMEEQKKKPGQSTSSASTNGTSIETPIKSRGRGRKRRVDEAVDKSGAETTSKMKKAKGPKVEKVEAEVDGVDGEDEEDKEDEETKENENEIEEAEEKEKAKVANNRKLSPSKRKGPAKGAKKPAKKPPPNKKKANPTPKSAPRTTSRKGRKSHRNDIFDC